MTGARFAVEMTGMSAGRGRDGFDITCAIANKCSVVTIVATAGAGPLSAPSQ